MTLKEFNDLYLGKAVHCETEELANEFLELADSFGYKWSAGDKLTIRNKWKEYGKNTYYRLFPYDKKYVRFGNIEYTFLKIIKFKGENKSKSIYDEALEIIDNNTFELGKGLDVLKPTYRDTVVKALKQAQKQEKLLELYRYLNENTNDYDLNYTVVDEIDNKISEIEKQIKELENGVKVE